jgi:glycosyltransferase involved in cell wall biosynthesis
VFVYLGLLVPGRGIERLLEVFGRADARSHIVFMGYGDRLGVGDAAQRCSNIHLHPAVSHEQVVEYVRHADCGVCLIEDVSLSDRLCLPNKLFEYAFAGLPVLASRLPEIERVVREYGLGVCCDNDVDSIRQVVEAIERDGISPSTADLTELSWERQAERLREAYRQLLDRQNGTTRNQPKAGER